MIFGFPVRVRERRESIALIMNVPPVRAEFWTNIFTHSWLADHAKGFRAGIDVSENLEGWVDSFRVTRLFPAEGIEA